MRKANKKEARKFRYVECVIEKSISAPFVSNKVKGDVVSVPKHLFDYYLEKGVVSKKTRKQKTEE